MLASVVAEGWSSAGDASLNAKMTHTMAVSIDSLPRNQISKVDCLKALVPDEVVGLYLLPSLNRHLANRSKHSHPNDKRYALIKDVNEFWKAIMRLFLVALSVTRTQFREKNKVIKRAKALLSLNRFKAIRAALNIDEACVLAFSNKLRDSVLESFDLGTLLVCDESLLEYAGADMRRHSTAAFFPHKPHPYGRLLHAIMSRTSRTNAIIVVEWQIRAGEQRLTPADSCLAMVERLERATNKKYSVFADGGFPAKQMIDRVANTDSETVYTMSISSAVGSGYKEFYDLVKPLVFPTTTYNFYMPGIVAQFTQLEAYVNAWVSTAFSTSTAADAPQSVKAGWTYERAVDYAASFNDSPELLASTVTLSPGVSRHDLVDIVKDVTGFDVSLPKPNEDGTPNKSREAVDDLKGWQVQLLNSRLVGTKPPKSSSIKTLKDSLFNRLNADTKKRKRDHNGHAESAVTYQSVKAFVGHNCPPHNIANLYMEVYGWQDQLNRGYYDYFSPAVCRDGEKLVLTTLIWWMVWNSRALFGEVSTARSHPNPPANMGPAFGPNHPHAYYLLELAEEFLSL